MKYFKLTVMLILLLSAVTSRAVWADGHRAGGHSDGRGDGHSDGRGEGHGDFRGHVDGHVGFRHDHPHPGHARFRVFIGAPLWWPLYYPAPYYSYYPYYPPAVAAPSSPPEYIEQGDAQAAQSNYWYYCTNPEGYYPYVKQCPDGWQKVVPQPPPP